MVGNFKVVRWRCEVEVDGFFFKLANCGDLARVPTQVCALSASEEGCTHSAAIQKANRFCDTRTVRSLDRVLFEADEWNALRRSQHGDEDGGDTA